MVTRTHTVTREHVRSRSLPVPRMEGDAQFTRSFPTQRQEDSLKLSPGEMDPWTRLNTSPTLSSYRHQAYYHVLLVSTSLTQWRSWLCTQVPVQSHTVNSSCTPKLRHLCSLKQLVFLMGGSSRTVLCLLNPGRIHWRPRKCLGTVSRGRPQYTVPRGWPLRATTLKRPTEATQEKMMVGSTPATWTGSMATDLPLLWQ